MEAYLAIDISIEIAVGKKSKKITCIKVKISLFLYKHL